MCRVPGWNAGLVRGLFGTQGSPVRRRPSARASCAACAQRAERPVSVSHLATGLAPMPTSSTLREVGKYAHGTRYENIPGRLPLGQQT
jgi:hypothetical protein